MRVYAPLDEEAREIEGELKGDWQLGGTKFETALSYPSYAFSARMTEGQKLDAKALADKVLPGIPLTRTLRHIRQTRRAKVRN